MNEFEKILEGYKEAIENNNDYKISYYEDVLYNIFESYKKLVKKLEKESQKYFDFILNLAYGKGEIVSDEEHNSEK